MITYTKLHSTQFNYHLTTYILKSQNSDTGFFSLFKYFIDLILSWFVESCKSCFSFSYNLIGFYKQALKSDYW